MHASACAHHENLKSAMSFFFSSLNNISNSCISVRNFFSCSVSFKFYIQHFIVYLLPYMIRVQTDTHTSFTPFKNVWFKTFKCFGYLISQLPYREPFFPPNDYECFKNLFAFIEEVAFYILLKRFFFNQQRGKILEWVVTDIMGMNEIICFKWDFYFLYVIRKGLGKGDKWRDLHLMPSFPFLSLGSSPYRRESRACLWTPQTICPSSVRQCLLAKSYPMKHT